jgi:hypothetical protein
VVESLPFVIKTRPPASDANGLESFDFPDHAPPGEWQCTKSVTPAAGWIIARFAIEPMQTTPCRLDGNRVAAATPSRERRCRPTVVPKQPVAHNHTSIKRVYSGAAAEWPAPGMVSSSACALGDAELGALRCCEVLRRFATGPRSLRVHGCSGARGLHRNFHCVGCARL